MSNNHLSLKGAFASTIIFASTITYQTWAGQAVYKNIETYRFYLSTHLINVSQSVGSQIKGGIFVGTQIRKMIASKELEEAKFDVEKNAWKAFKVTVEEFLGNHRKDDYVLMVSNLIRAY